MLKDNDNFWLKCLDVWSIASLYSLLYTSIGLMAPFQSNCKLHHVELSTHYTYWTAHLCWTAKTNGPDSHAMQPTCDW